MESIKVPEYRIIHEETASDFQRELNKAVKELAEFNPKVKFNDTLGFCAYIEYQPKEIVKPESVRDEFMLEGIYYHCRNCPYLELPQDRRVKWGKCKYSTTGRAHKDTEACELFYKWVQQNAIDVVEDSDLLLW